MKKTILVTGGLGYIGSHTVVELQNKGFEVVIIDNLSNSNIEVLDRITSITGVKPQFEQIDLKDKQAVQHFFKYYSIDGVIHFAASKAVGESVNEPLKYYENNITTLTYVLQEMLANSVSNFIFSSSCTVYGQADELPITESALPKPAASPYGATKRMGEIIIEDTTKATELKAIQLRYFNPIGAHASAKIGELPLGIPQNLVPFVVQTAAGIRESLSIFGDDYPTPDGTAIRDYIHVVDLAKAHIAALNRLLENKQKKDCEYFNIGTGKGSSVLEIVKAFEEATRQNVNYSIAPRRAGDISAAYADTTLAHRELGWKAETSLQDSLASSWKWQESLKE